MTESRDDSQDLEAQVRKVQEAKDNGEPASRVRMRLVMDGIDPAVADAVIDRVYNDAPLRERYRDMAAKQTAKFERADRVASGNYLSWAWWIAALVGINVLSYVFDWPFWIY